MIQILNLFYVFNLQVLHAASVRDRATVLSKSKDLKFLTGFESKVNEVLNPVLSAATAFLLMHLTFSFQFLNHPYHNFCFHLDRLLLACVQKTRTMNSVNAVALSSATDC